MSTSMTQDSDSEFGYDFSIEDEELLLQLASKDVVPRQSTPLPDRSETGTVISSVSDTTESLFGDDASTVTGYTHTYSRRNNGKIVPFSRAASTVSAVEDRPRTLPSPVSLDEDVTYPDLTLALQGLESEPLQPVETIDEDDLDPYDDGRSPLQKFRSFPKKPLTVSDLTSGAWCELQYWYTLTRLPGGRRTRTTAMRQGSKIHQKLEEEVYPTTTKIEILSKEDGFGLRLWNLVQGLRTLRDIGLTRELEVWGMVDGNLVNGVIDSLSYENPDPEFEEELSSQGSQSSLHQTTLADYFPPMKSTASNSPKVYLTDVKTRGSLSPASAALLRPAKYQLLLYHRFLSDMAAGKLDYFKMFRRYGLDADERFSDAFMSQIGELHDEIFFDTPTSSNEQASQANKGKAEDTNTVIADPPSSSPGIPDLLKYGTLRELLALVKAEIKLTFPLGASSLGHMLRVQYIYRDDGRDLGTHNFPVSRQILDGYLSKYMRWWRGERKAFGVDIEEAFKCRTCEFAESCTWRKDMDQQRVRKANEKVWEARRGKG